MTDKPILFSGPMVRAILDGRKTQTRRVLKCPACGGRGVIFRSPGVHGGCPVSCSKCEGYGDRKARFKKGDRLWVRETWRTSADFNNFKPSDLNGNAPVQWEVDGGRSWTWRNDLQAQDHPGKARPSIFMPRWASRLTLIVDQVRVQRLKEITASDAKAEGLSQSPAASDAARECGCDWTYPGEVRVGSPISAFAYLWNGINEPCGFGWDENPWVVAVTFRTIRANIDSEEVRDAA